MSSNDFSDFIVPEIEVYHALPDGAYVAQVDHMECVNNEYGKYYTVNWRILRPSEFEGNIHQERFSINHANDKVRHIAIQNFAKFCVEIGGLSQGDVPSDNNFLFKVANILIRNKAAKDGMTYANIVKRELVDKNLHAESAPVNNAYDNAMSQYATIPIPQNVPLPSVELNDGVPF